MICQRVHYAADQSSEGTIVHVATPLTYILHLLTIGRSQSTKLTCSAQRITLSPESRVDRLDGNGQCPRKLFAKVEIKRVNTWTIRHPGYNLYRFGTIAWKTAEGFFDIDPDVWRNIGKYKDFWVRRHAFENVRGDRKDFVEIEIFERELSEPVKGGEKLAKRVHRDGDATQLKRAIASRFRDLVGRPSGRIPQWRDWNYCKDLQIYDHGDNQKIVSRVPVQRRGIGAA